MFLRIAASDSDKDRGTFSLSFCSSHWTRTVNRCSLRESVIATVSRFHPPLVAGLSNRVPPGLSGRSPASLCDGIRLLKEQKPLAEQWYTWVKALCATATVSEPLRPGPLNIRRSHLIRHLNENGSRPVDYSDTSSHFWTRSTCFFVMQLSCASARFHLTLILSFWRTRAS